MELGDESVPAPASSVPGLTPTRRGMLEAIENLPDDVRELLGLMGIPGITHVEAAWILGDPAATWKMMAFQ